MSTDSKTILVTGASSGIGQQIALTLAAAGHRVFGTSRTPLPDQGSPDNPVRMLQLDVTDDASVEACIRQLLSSSGHLDVLINNAGSGLTGAIEDCEPDEVLWQMDTNFMGPLRMLRAVLPAMRQQGHGRIINIGSMAGHAALPYQGIYSASKHAMEAINEALRLELTGSNIDSTIVCPGDFRTGFTQARVFARNAGSAAHANRMKTTVAVYEHDEINGAPPGEVAKLILNLVSARKIRVRYFVGRMDQRLGMLLKRLLPAGLFEAIFRSIYKLR